MTGDAAELLLKFAQDQGIAPDEALRRAIAIEARLYSERRNGSRVLIVTAEKEIREILFR